MPNIQIDATGGTDDCADIARREAIAAGRWQRVSSNICRRLPSAMTTPTNRHLQGYRIIISFPPHDGDFVAALGENLLTSITVLLVNFGNWSTTAGGSSRSRRRRAELLRHEAARQGLAISGWLFPQRPNSVRRRQAKRLAKMGHRGLSKSGRPSNASSEISRTSPTVFRPAANSAFFVRVGNRLHGPACFPQSSGVGSTRSFPRLQPYRDGGGKTFCLCFFNRIRPNSGLPFHGARMAAEGSRYVLGADLPRANALSRRVSASVHGRVTSASPSVWLRQTRIPA